MASLDRSRPVLDKDGVRLTVDDAVATVTLTNPAKRNAQIPALWRALTRGRAVAAGQRPGRRAAWRGQVLLRGARPAGVHARGLRRRAVVHRPRARVRRRARRDHRRVPGGVHLVAAQRHRVRSPPSRGTPSAPGFQLALACDLRVVADDVQFAMRETSLGLVPDLTGHPPAGRASSGTPARWRSAPPGRFVHAEEAERTGLANLVVPAERARRGGRRPGRRPARRAAGRGRSRPRRCCAGAAGAVVRGAARRRARRPGPPAARPRGPGRLTGQSLPAPRPPPYAGTR